jgi:ABC-type iron transport system FetAB ATPase subunit
LEIWNQSSSSDAQIPLNHRSRFIEAVQELQFDVMNQILHKEIQELNGGRAQIQAVQKAIEAREECMKQIRKNDIDEQENASKEAEVHLPS